MNCGSLTVVGTGIKFIAHLTSEARLYIKQADKVLYLVNDPALKLWIARTNIKSESLDALYSKYTLRSQCYQEITEYILNHVRKAQHVCVVLYGHPTVFARPALKAVKLAKAEGIDAIVLPGISAEDCLFADLLINPGSVGCQSYEATDFLIYDREFDVSSHLVLWQVGGIGNLKHTRMSFDNKHGAIILMKKLLQKYKKSHEIVLYEAAQHTGFTPRVEKISLSELPNANFSPLTTLYLPPAEKRQINIHIAADLKMDIKNFN